MHRVSGSPDEDRSINMLYYYFYPLHENDGAGVDDWWVHITYFKSFSSTYS